MRRRFAAVLFAGLVFQSGPAAGADSAVVLAYPRIAAGPAASTLKPELLDAHIKELQNGGFKVMRLGEIAAALRDGRALPDRAVALTFDSGHRSIHQTVWPKLRAARMPFAIFIATDRPGASPDYLAWHQLSEMAAAGVEIGVQGTGDLRLAAISIEKARADIQRALQRMGDELGKTARLFAYPYGEFGRAVAEEIEKAGFTAGFGLHSGAAHASQGLYALPRFALNDRYGELGRFRTIVNALPLPMRDLVPADPLIAATNLSGANPPTLGFTVDPPVERLEELGCTSSDGGRASVDVLGGVRVEVRFPAAFPPGRARVNCTMTGPDGRWRWLGIPFVIQRP